MISATARTDVTVRSPSTFRANVLLLLASVALSAIVLEIAARQILPAPLPWLFPQIAYRSDPVLGFALVPNQRSFTADKPVAINERGLRGALVPYPRSNMERLLFLGDSITFGYGVDDADVVTERVRTLRARDHIASEVINAAVPAYNMTQEVNYFETEGMRYHPHRVIVGFCWNDVGDKSQVRVDSQGRLTDDAPEPDGADVPESPFTYQVRNVMKRSRLMYGTLQAGRTLRSLLHPDAVSTLRAEVLEGRDTERTRLGWGDIALQMHRLRSLADREGIKPLVVAFPIPLKLARSFPNSSYPARLLEIGSREGVPVIDLEPPFRDAFSGHDSLFIQYDGDHPNAAGHAIAADEIHAFLVAHADSN